MVSKIEKFTGNAAQPEKRDEDMEARKEGKEKREKESIIIS